MELIIETAGTKLSKNGNCLKVKNNETELLLSPEKIENIILEGEVSLTKGAILLALENNIPIIISDKNRKIKGTFWKPADDKTGKLRRNQYQLFNSVKGLELGREWIIEKLENQKKQVIALINRRDKKELLKPYFIMTNYIEKLKELDLTVEGSETIIMGYEGIASKYYFQIINELLEDRWKVDKREYQNAKKPYNIILNYLYGFLYNTIERAILINGFDPYTGIIHKENSNKMPFVYDLIEKYRYLALESCFQLFSQKIVNNSFFELKDNKYILSAEGKIKITEFYYKKLNHEIEFQGKKYKAIDTIKKYVTSLKIDLTEGKEAA